MKRDDLTYSGEMFYEHLCEYAGIRFRLVSDDLFMKEIDFFKGGNFTVSQDGKTPPPIKIFMQYLHSYFNPEYDEIFSVLFRHNWKDTMVIKGSVKLGSIVLDMDGYTETEVRVYRELIRTKPGERISYGDLAIRCGIPGGARFIGNTMAKNRFPVIVPCHRVIKSDGSIGNFSGGEEIKRNLLRHESEKY